VEKSVPLVVPQHIALHKFFCALSRLADDSKYS